MSNQTKARETRLGRKEPNTVIVIVVKSTFSMQIWRRGTPKKRARVYDVVFACALAHP